jgi:hypothetical protein
MPLFDFLHSSPASHAVVVSPNDNTDLTTYSRGLYVGAAGNLAVLMAQDSVSVTFNSVPAGSLLPLAVKRVLATGTTAGNIIAVY